MDAEDIRTWSERYDAVYDTDLREIENRIHDALNDQQSLTNDELQDVVRWKFNGMPGRRGRNVDRVGTVPNVFVRRVTEAALLTDEPTIQLKTLKSIPGIGPATGTVVLAFYDPENYGIGDRYILNEFFGEDRTMRVADYPKILAELRERNPGNFDLRTIEKAYYQKFRVENDVGNW